MRLALLHSPLVGPAVWRPVEALATASEIAARVLALPELSEMTSNFYDRLVEAAAGQLREWGRSVLVAHSGAGGLIAPLVNAAPALVEKVIFVDAILPHPGRAWLATAGEDLAKRVTTEVDNGFAPPWDRWFPRRLISKLIPDDDDRGLFLGELRATPVGFLREAAPDVGLPETLEWSYLRLSVAYEREAQIAQDAGRRTRRLDIHHLAAITHPGEVLSAISSLAAAGL